MAQPELPPSDPSTAEPDLRRFADLRRAVMQRRSTARRTRLGRWALVLLVAAVALIVLVIWRRDSLRRQEAVDGLGKYMAQAAASGQPKPWPGSFIQAVPLASLRALPPTQPVVLAYDSKPRQLILLANGHPVVLAVGSHLQAAWMTQRQLDAQLKRQQQLLQAPPPSPPSPP
jgi:hypothetical protein